jgi:rhodanese-related sulfurtransferase
MSIKELSVQDLKKMLDQKSPLQLIDVREADEKQIADIGGELIPLATIPQAGERVARDRPVVVYCRSGGRSLRACQYLAQHFGVEEIYNLSGGILAWAEAIDPTLQKY